MVNDFSERQCPTIEKRHIKFIIFVLSGLYSFSHAWKNTLLSKIIIGVRHLAVHYCIIDLQHRCFGKNMRWLQILGIPQVEKIITNLRYSWYEDLVFLDFSVGVGAFVIGLRQISSFFSWPSRILVFNLKSRPNVLSSRYPWIHFRVFLSQAAEYLSWVKQACTYVVGAGASFSVPLIHKSKLFFSFFLDKPSQPPNVVFFHLRGYHMFRGLRQHF